MPSPSRCLKTSLTSCQPLTASYTIARAAPLPAAKKSELLQSIRHLCIDTVHAAGHGPDFPCSPENRRHLARRLTDVNTSVAEQTFGWSRNHAAAFNLMSRETHLSTVLLYAMKHNDTMRTDYRLHLSPFNKNLKRRSVSSKYHCRQPAASSSFIHQRQATSTRKRPSSSLKRPAKAK